MYDSWSARLIRCEWMSWGGLMLCGATVDDIARTHTYTNILYHRPARARSTSVLAVHLQRGKGGEKYQAAALGMCAMTRAVALLPWPTPLMLDSPHAPGQRHGQHLRVARGQ